jgi:DNA-binding Lrp family transcriptional regulator
LIKMVDGIIMVKTVRGHERRIHSMLRSLPGIKAMYILFGGDFDLLMDAQVEGLSALNGLIEEVREVEGVVTTRTILAYDPERCSQLGMEAC